MNLNEEYINNASSVFSQNVTDNITDDRVDSSKPAVMMKIFNPLISIVILICEVIAICILKQCKTVPHQCLQLSTSYLLSDIIGALFYIFYFFLIQFFNFNTDFIQNSQIVFVSIMNNISSASLTAIIIERVIALKADLNYVLTSQRAKIVVTIILIWLLHTTLPLCILTFNSYHQCKFQMTSCDTWKVSAPTKYTCLTILIAYDIVLLKAYIFVHKVAKTHAAQIDSMQHVSFTRSNEGTKTVSERQYASIKVCMKLVSVHLLLKTPMVVLMLIGTTFQDAREHVSMNVLRYIAYMLIKVNSIINLYLYIWKIGECKMFCYLWLAKLFKKYEKIATDKRVEVYNIVVVFERDNNRIK